MGCSGRSFAVEGSRRSKPVKSRVANFSRKEGTLLLGFSSCGKKQVMYGMYSGRSFAVEGSRRSKPVKSRVANFSRKKRGDSTFGLFWLWEETGYVWDVVA